MAPIILRLLLTCQTHYYTGEMLQKRANFLHENSCGVYKIVKYVHTIQDMCALTQLVLVF